MQEKDREVKNRTIEIIRWLAKHPKIQRRICCEEYTIEPDECLEIMEILEKNGFYELMYILLRKNEQHLAIDYALEGLKTEAWANEWGKVGNEQMCRTIKERIRNGIQLLEMGKDEMF